jgi:hypothetical protein
MYTVTPSLHLALEHEQATRLSGAFLRAHDAFRKVSLVLSDIAAGDFGFRHQESIYLDPFRWRFKSSSADVHDISFVVSDTIVP